MVRVRLDGQRRIRIPKKSGVEGDTFLILSLGSYHILFPVSSKKPELYIDESISGLPAQAEVGTARNVSERWTRKDHDSN